MHHLLAIDQGSSHTWAILCDLRGNLLGLGKSRGACHTFDGLETAMSAIREASESALAQAGAAREDLALLFSGMTGADWADEFPMLTQAIQSLGICANVQVVNDSIIAMRGGTQRPYGAILIGGSAANCAARAADGRMFIYGFYHDFELQGAFGLGRSALNAVYRAQVGLEPPTRLTARLLELYQVGDVDSLLRADIASQMMDPRLMEIPPILFAAAEAGDPAAARIVYSYGKGSAELLVNALRRLDMTGLQVEVVLFGGIFKARGPLLTDALRAHLHLAAPRAVLVNARYEPVVGAALLGLEAAGVAVEGQVKENIEVSAVRMGLIRVEEED